MKIDLETQRRLAVQETELDCKIAVAKRYAAEAFEEQKALAKLHEDAIEWGLLTFPAVRAVK